MPRTDGYAYRAEIEPLVERHRHDAAALTCANALIDQVFVEACFNSVRAKRLRERLPFLAQPGMDISLAKGKNIRELLQQVIAMPKGPRDEFALVISEATEILRRLNSLSPAPLTEEEDEFVATLARSRPVSTDFCNKIGTSRANARPDLTSVVGASAAVLSTQSHSRPRNWSQPFSIFLTVEGRRTPKGLPRTPVGSVTATLFGFPQLFAEELDGNCCR